MRKGIKISLIVIVIIIFAVLIYYYYTRPAALQEPEDKGVQVGKAIPVKVTIAQRDTLIHYINTEGRAGEQKIMAGNCRSKRDRSGNTASQRRLC